MANDVAGCDGGTGTSGADALDRTSAAYMRARPMMDTADHATVAGTFWPTFD